MASVRDLAILQDAEDRLHRNTIRRREIANELQDPEDLVNARQQVNEIDEKLTSLRKALRTLEAEAETVRQKREAGEKRLYSGKVGNPRELQHLENESKSLSRRLSQLDDRMLDLMIEIDQATQHYKESSERLATLEDQNKQRVQELMHEREQLEAEAAELTQTIERLSEALPSELLSRYQALKARKGGRGVAHLRNNICQACGVQVPTHVVQRVQQGQELVTCPSCGRLLSPD